MSNTSKLKPGDKVKVKSWEEIKKIRKFIGFSAKKVLQNDFCGKTFTIKKIRTGQQLDEIFLKENSGIFYLFEDELQLVSSISLNDDLFEL